jgi:hypothetical protein
MRVELLQVVGVLGQLGGHDELVAGGDCLGVVALHAAFAGVQEAAVGVGDVGGRFGVGGLVARPGLELPRWLAFGPGSGGGRGDPLRIPLLALRRRAQLERGDEEAGQGGFVAGAEARDGHVVGRLVGGQDAEGEVLEQRRWICREERTPVA